MGAGGAHLALAVPAAMDLGSSPLEPPARLETEPLMRMLLEGDATGAWQLVRPLLEADGYEHVAVGAVQPALYQVGRLWQRHQLSVAQEHLATAQASLLLSHAFTAVPMARPHERRALFAAVEGNRHALGSRMLGDVFALKGWRVQELGADVPTRDLVGQIERFEPQVVGLSAALPQHVAAVRDAFARIRADFGARRPILLAGGLPFNQVEGLADRVGADGWHPDARRAGADGA